MPYLQFKGKTAVETYHHSLPHHTLSFDEEMSILGPCETSSLEGNLIIEGDNLLALKALLPTHAGRIKCAYIDPPYNTGNEHWVYSDNLTQPQFREWLGSEVGKEADDACRHDKWCCMMWPRLSLIRQLLSEDGVIFVSIDENEFGHVRLMLDEIFLVEKPLATFVWKRRSPSGMRSTAVSVDHEYVLMYAKSQKDVTLSGLITEESDYPLVDVDGRRYASTDLTIGMTADERENQFYSIKNPRSGIEYPANPARVWRFEPETMRQVIEDDLVIWPDEADGKMTRPRYKTYFDPAKPKFKPVSSWIETSSRKPTAQELEDEEDIEVISSGMNSDGGKVLQRILGQKLFDYPKPPSLIQSLVRIATRHNDIVLDAFAGSGTTGQAVIDLNAEDGENRKFLLIQMPFETRDQLSKSFNVCRFVTRERICKIITGYTYTVRGKQATVEGIDATFSYCRVSNSPLFGDFTELGEKMPKYEDLARYIYFTETSQQIKDNYDVSRIPGKIGEWKDTSFYLLYRESENAEWGMDKQFLKNIEDDPKSTIVVYCEMLRVHRDDLKRWQTESGKTVRTMLVPYNLK